LKLIDKFAQTMFRVSVLAAGAIISCSAKLTTTVVQYMDGETELEGYLAFDDAWSADQPRPAVIVAADWDGLNGHEQDWAERLVTLGYVGFANGVYTPSETAGAVDQPSRAALTRKYAGDTGLWRGRMRAAVELLQDHELVDSEKIGALGFCFGGGGVLELARANFPGVHAVVSLHGNFGTQSPAELGNFDSRVLVLHGADDPNINNTPQRGDNSGAMGTLQAELETADADWEITVFADVVHGFSDPGNPGYDSIATERSWASTANFFEDVFTGYSEPDNEGLVPSTIVTEWVDYMDGDTALKGYLAYNSELAGPLPAVLVSHDWDGITEHELVYARNLAKEGYIAFANGVFTPEENEATATDIAARMASTRKYGGDVDLHRGRMKAAVALLKNHEKVHNERIGAVGFCFGGSSVLELARENVEGVVGVVSLHGSLSTARPTEGDMKSRVLVLHGAKDANINDGGMRGESNAGVMPALEAELSAANAEWEVTRFGKAVHSFSEPSVGDNPASGNAYNPMAARRSWAHTIDFLGASFGRPYRYPNPVVAAPLLCSVDSDCPEEQICSSCSGPRRRLLFGGVVNQAAESTDTCFCA
jgi:dienelactone hydrolase